MFACKKFTNGTKKASRADLIKTRKATGFKSVRLNCWEINQVTSICQIDFWRKLAKNV